MPKEDELNRPWNVKHRPLWVWKQRSAVKRFLITFYLRLAWRRIESAIWPRAWRPKPVTKKSLPVRHRLPVVRQNVDQSSANVIADIQLATGRRESLHHSLHDPG